MVAACERTESRWSPSSASGPTRSRSYGVVAAVGPPTADGLVAILDMVEKPPAAEAPSDLAIMGRYVLTPDVFDRIAALRPGAGGELQLTDAMLRTVQGRASSTDCRSRAAASTPATSSTGCAPRSRWR